jgi:RNA polymerase sigma factor (TIGR02999 family)
MLPLVYDELHRIASAYLRRERREHTLQPTALVHEAYLRLAGQDDLDWKNRAHFRAIAATTMRRILIEHARARGRKKRGEAPERVALEDTVALAPAPRVDLEAIDQALVRLEDLDRQQARIVELRFFAGLSVEETAEVLSISRTTVKRDWAMARAWLRRELERI